MCKLCLTVIKHTIRNLLMYMLYYKIKTLCLIHPPMNIVIGTIFWGKMIEMLMREQSNDGLERNELGFDFFFFWVS